MIRIEIETDNAAFADDGCSEVARILRKFADKIDGCSLPQDWPEPFNLHDINGNWVGKATLGAEHPLSLTKEDT